MAAIYCQILLTGQCEIKQLKFAIFLSHWACLHIWVASCSWCILQDHCQWWTGHWLLFIEPKGILECVQVTNHIGCLLQSSWVQRNYGCSACTVRDYSWLPSLTPDRYFEVLHQNSLSSCFGQTSNICVPFSFFKLKLIIFLLLTVSRIYTRIFCPSNSLWIL